MTVADAPNATEDIDLPAGPAREVAVFAFVLGCTAFGGPAAHIAMMRREVVEHRKWLEDVQFMILMAVANLMPGPNSTELIMLVGKVRAGVRGLLAAGIAFITPAALITLACAALYTKYGTTRGVEWLLYGLKPVIIVIILHALYGMIRSELTSPGAKRWTTACVAIAAMMGYLAGLNELAVLLVGGIAFLGSRSVVRRIAEMRSLTVSLVPLNFGAIALALAANESVPYSASRLFWSFLKIGAVLYGSGYVLIAFLRSEFVVERGWITEQQLLDAIAFGQITPGPLFSTATFVGYLVGGVTGALIATVAIFLPAFVFSLAGDVFLGLFTNRQRMMLLLRGVVAASIGLMAGVTLQLGRDALIDGPALVIAIVAAYFLFRRSVGSSWLILGGAVAGLAVQGALAVT